MGPAYRDAMRGPAARVLLLPSLLLVASLASAADNGMLAFRNHVQPILKEYCYDCHADGANKGNVAFDELNSEQAVLENHELWFKALKNLRAGLMPPPKKAQPAPEQKLLIEQWIKTSVFKADPASPDPGRVTVRRLNRVEYRNTIRDLMGVEFDTDKEFPPDDSGHGFDNIGDVLTLPPMLLEKYLAAAKSVVNKAVPMVSRVPDEHMIVGKKFRSSDSTGSARTNRNPNAANALSLSYYEQASATNSYKAEHGGRYQLLLDFTASEKFVDNQFDRNKCRLVFKVDGKELHRHEYMREGGKAFHYEFDQSWKPGAHELVLDIEPLTPDQKQVRSLTLRIDSVTVRGPLDQKHYVRPKNYEKFFPTDPPKGAPARRQYARRLLVPFVEKAYRRPVDAPTVDRLVALAESGYSPAGKTFEQGIAQSMVAVLASPRFLFREESPQPAVSGASYPLVDEFALASRLSYFLWSSLPDDELFQLAKENKLRENLPAQTRRMLEDRKSEALVRNFVGQWLQARDIENVQIDARQVLQRESAADPNQERRRERFRELRDKPEANLTAAEKKELDDIRATFFRRGAPRVELTGDLRRAMRQETEKTFDYVLRQDKSLLELLDSDYTFLNERLATHYGLTNLHVKGEEMRFVKLPPDSPRGGVITEGTVLVVTSNPSRTSPVKRGLFILDNLLGTPPPPPPPNIPPLENAAKAMKGKTLTLRETLALHREQPLCASCHNRMDPLGLAFENFNAMGMWRDQERGQHIDATGTLLTGESFATVKELKKILVTGHSRHYYHTVTEKLLTYALGRGLEYYDVVTVDKIVDQLEKSDGRPSALLKGIIESAPFQKTRAFQLTESAIEPPAQRADNKSKL